MTDKKTTYFSRRRANSWQKKKVAIGKATDFATRVRECDYCGRLNIPVGTNGKLAKHTTSTNGLLWPTSGKTSLDKTQWDNAHKKWNALALVEHLPARDRLHRALDAVLDRRAAKDASGTWQTTPKKAAYYGITNPTPGIDFNTYDYSINGEWLGSAGYGGGSAPYTAQVMYVLGTRPDGQPRRSSKSKSFSSIAAAKAFVESNAAPTGSPHRAKDTAARDAVDLKRQAALTQLRKLQENDFQNASNKEEEARAKYKAAGSAQRAALSAKWDAASAKVEEISRKMDAIAKSFPGLYDEL